MNLHFTLIARSLLCIVGCTVLWLVSPVFAQPDDGPGMAKTLPPPPRIVPSLLGKIVYGAVRDRQNSLFALDPGSGVEINIGPCPSPNQRFSLSADGRTMVYSFGTGAPNPETQVPTIHIWRSNIDRTEPRQLTREATWHDYPSLSADGQRVAWMAMVDKRFQVFVMNTDGTDIVQLSKQPMGVATPVISPDGKFVVYYAGKQLFRVQADGTGEKQLTSGPGSNFGQAVSRDGQTVFYLHKADKKQDIYRMNSDGSDPTQLTALQADFGQLALSPDGKQIVFRSNFEGWWKLYRMNIDGTGLRLVIANAETNSIVSWPGDAKTAIPPLPIEGALDNGMNGLPKLPGTGVRPASPNTSEPSVGPSSTAASSARPVGGVLIFPLVDASTISPASVAGTAETAAEIKNVTLALMRYPTPESSQTESYWNWRESAWQPTYVAEQHEAIVTGTKRWKLEMPSLPGGSYGIRATAIDVDGKNQQSAIKRFRVVPSAVVEKPKPPDPSPEVNLVELKTSAPERTVTLRFSGPLDADTASRMSSYKVVADNQPVKLHGISFDARQYAVTLKLAVAIADVNTLKVEWRGAMLSEDAERVGAVRLECNSPCSSIRPCSSST